MNYLISIIIPAYNIESLLAKTLDSVLAQTYSNMEVIVINDGSTDGTGKIIEQYAENDQRIIPIHKKNGGVSSARLMGIEKAKGEYIGFVDGDDYIEPEMYERLINNALKYNADISHCGYQMIFPNRVDYYYNSEKLVIQDNLTGLKDLLEGAYVEPGLWNKLYRKPLFKKLLYDDNIFPVDIRINEDLLMNYWLFKASNLAVYEDFCPYHYLVRKGSAANSAINGHKLWDPLRVIRIIMADVPNEVEPVAYQKLVRLLISGAAMESKNNPNLIEPYRAETLKELRIRLCEILMTNKCNLKLKVMALWTTVWPASYKWIHDIHLRVTGLDKIYDLE